MTSIRRTSTIFKFNIKVQGIIYFYENQNTHHEQLIKLYENVQVLSTTYRMKIRGAIRIAQ